MRRTAVVVAVLVALGACGTGPSASRGAPPSTASSSTTTTATTTTPTQPSVTTTMRPAKPTTTAATPPEPTQVILFSAFNNGAPSPRLSVVAETTGTCSQPSSADAGRPSAYRCFNDDSTIADPCFTDDDGVAGFLLCFGVIADESTVKVTPRELRPQGLDPDAMTQATPWALDLTDGQRCDFVLGGTAANDAGRLNYVCQQGVVYGETDRSSDSWIVQFQATGTEALVPIAVAAAYY